MIDILKYKITKTQFKKIIANKCSHLTTPYHIFNVVNILIDELGKDLYLRNKKIKIKNFCEISIEETKPRKYWSIHNKKVEVSLGKPQVKIKVFEPLKKILYKKIDIESL